LDDRLLIKSLGPVGPVFFRGFQELRPSQRAAIPPVMGGQNILLACPTASGKTEALFAPLIGRVLARAVGSASPGDDLRILAIAPTRALVNDLYERLSPLLEELGLTCGRQTSDHHSGKRLPFLLITTPESFDSLLARRSVYAPSGRLEGHALMAVVAVFIDEVHLFDNSARGDQLLWLLARLRRLKRLASEGADPLSPLHVCAASATVSNPHDLATRVLGPNAQVIEIPGGRELVVLSCNDPDGWASVADFESAPDLLPEIARLNDPESLDEIAKWVWLAMSKPHQDKPIRKVLVFVPSRTLCDRLSVVMKGFLASRRSISVFAHHGSLDRSIREDSEKGFGGRKDAVLVATSTLEVGVDIGDVDAVTLVGPPSTTNGLLQRIGRSGRREGITRVIGIARNKAEQSALASMLVAARDGICDPLPYGRRLSVFVQQASSYVYQGPDKGRRQDDLVALARDVWGEEGASTFTEVLDHLVQQNCLEDRYGERLAIGSSWQEIWDGIGMHGNIDSGGAGMPVVNVVTGETIAHLPPGTRVDREVSLGGQTWQARVERGEVLLRGTDGKRSAAGVRYAASAGSVGYPFARHVALGLGLSDACLVCVNHSSGPYLFYFGGELIGRILRALHPGLLAAPNLVGIALMGYVEGAAAITSVDPQKVRLVWSEVAQASARALGCGQHHRWLPSSVQQRTCREIFPFEFADRWLKSRKLVEAGEINGLEQVLLALIDESTPAQVGAR
jgi:ATP-dependent Lhr-like helicase